jgi:ketosteroid isomerase-like protein
MESLATEKKTLNIKVVRDAFNNFLQGNINAIINSCSDNVVWTTYENPDIPYARTYKGKKGVENFFSDLSSSIDYSIFEPKEYFGDGEKVFVKGFHKAKVRSTGKEFAHDFLMEFEIRDGKISYFFPFTDTRDTRQMLLNLNNPS